MSYYNIGLTIRRWHGLEYNTTQWLWTWILNWLSLIYANGLTTHLNLADQTNRFVMEIKKSQQKIYKIGLSERTQNTFFFLNYCHVTNATTPHYHLWPSWRQLEGWNMGQSWRFGRQWLFIGGFWFKYGYKLKGFKWSLGYKLIGFWRMLRVMVKEVL